MTTAAQQTSEQARPQTPYERMGGEDTVSAIVERFYDLMETDADYQALRELHQPDLAPMRAALTGFLTGWLGGPRIWFDQNPGKCMMSMHNGVAVTATTARQWTDAMRRAMTDAGLDPAILEMVDEAFTRVATAMAGGRA